jgi:hypothetical protein
MAAFQSRRGNEGRRRSSGFACGCSRRRLPRPKVLQSGESNGSAPRSAPTQAAAALLELMQGGGVQLGHARLRAVRFIGQPRQGSVAMAVVANWPWPLGQMAPTRLEWARSGRLDRIGFLFSFRSYFSLRKQFQ